MTVRAVRFTPHVMLETPMRSRGLPNSDASRILYVSSTYSFENHSKKTEVRILDVGKNESRLVLEDQIPISSVSWLGDDEILLQRSREKSGTEFVVGQADNFAQTNYVAGAVDYPVSNLKIKSAGDGSFLVALTAQAAPDGTLINPNNETKPLSTGRLYKSLFVRHWDQWITPNRNTIVHGTLQRGSAGKYKLSPLKNALKDTKLESPVPPFGGLDHFDISTSGLAFVAKDPSLDPALNTRSNVYFVPLNEMDSGTSQVPYQIPLAIFAGASTSPVFSPDGKQLAFLSMKKNGYEADKNHIFVVPDIEKPFWVVQFLASHDGNGRWNRSPTSITWSHNAKTLYLTAEDIGRVGLFSLPADPFKVGELPHLLLGEGSVEAVQPLLSGRIFVSGDSLIEPSWYRVVEPTNATSSIIWSSSRGGSSIGISRDQISTITYKGAESNVQAWVFKPSTFNENEKYPLAMLVHGGPQGAWLDSWSLRWNPAVFAEQGYVVICPNPTGSTGFGQDFTDAIQTQWGGLPYEDLVKLFEYVEKGMHFVDTSRAVALGASYGGYMMNWIQGQPLGRKFKALVTHDGVFSMAGQMASEELYFPEHDFGGKFWKHRDEWLRFDPARFTENWATPHLIIHSELDFRLTISEGLAAFNTLQNKGIESQFLTFPDENHWVLKPENSLHWHTVVLNWINSHVGLPPYGEENAGYPVQTGTGPWQKNTTIAVKT